MPKFNPIPENLFFKRIAMAIILLFSLILIGSLVLLPNSGSFSEAFGKSASQVTKIPLAGEHPYIFFILALFGYVLAFYTVYVTIEFALEGKFRHLFRGARMENKIKKMKDHCIVCGYGRVGKNVVKKLQDSGKNVVIIEKNPSLVNELRENGHYAIEGTIEEEDLINAGVKSAEYLITCTGDDGRNLLLIMAAKELNPHIVVSSRASDEKIIKKMKYAGATYVVMPEELGGKEIVESILRAERRLSKGKYYGSH